MRVGVFGDFMPGLPGHIITASGSVFSCSVKLYATALKVVPKSRAMMSCETGTIICAVLNKGKMARLVLILLVSRYKAAPREYKVALMLKSAIWPYRKSKRNFYGTHTYLRISKDGS
jgi:hypothetical protein